MLLNLLLLFAVKLGDSTLATMKSVFTIQGRRYLAMFSITGSQLLYLVLIKFMDNSIYGFATVAIAIMSGQYIGMAIGDKIKKESTWKLIVKVPFQEGEKLARELSQLEYEVETNKVYFKGKKQMNVTVFAPTKNDTKIIKSACPVGTEVEIIEIKNLITL